MQELPIIEKTYELIRWYVPIINRMPRVHKFTLGDRLANGLYTLLDGLIEARYSPQKRVMLGDLNIRLEQLRFQTRLMFDFQLLSAKRYEHASLQLRAIGVELGSWLKQQSQKA